MEKKVIEEKVCEVIRANCQFNKENIILDADLRDNYGIDSIAIVNILIEIECMFDITIDSNKLSYDYFSTMGKIVNYLHIILN